MCRVGEGSQKRAMVLEVQREVVRGTVLGGYRRTLLSLSFARCIIRAIGVARRKGVAYLLSHSPFNQSAMAIPIVLAGPDPELGLCDRLLESIRTLEGS